MTAADETNEIEHDVVISDEGRYSIWPTWREIPAGWSATGFRGGRQACLDHIAEVWTDMRPLSLRRAMDAAAGGSSAS
ncbi:MbtH family protein [Methylobrevis pamukkalensis]|uniref:MbtH-like protein n=1 Tax=Methylobrevis pamukkalensis TaxID=1439726 RepID=A0A1E3H796_9HYPH|nr:MbtH family NRPS accessory protein [Methylobrevis pamukkalensis]ODN72174.1 MbtH-like protein [Methylobrevis pamukkalensis]